MLGVSSALRLGIIIDCHVSFHGVYAVVGMNHKIVGRLPTIGSIFLLSSLRNLGIVVILIYTVADNMHTCVSPYL